MKKAILCICLAALSAQAGARPTSQSFDLFEYKGYETATPVTRIANLGVCRDGGAGQVACTDLTTIENVRNVGVRAVFVEDRLHAVAGVFDSGDFIGMLAAFTTKYGLSTSITKSRLQGRAGATVAQWKFSDGVLTLESTGPKAGTAAFRFTASAGAPSIANPPVNLASRISSALR